MTVADLIASIIAAYPGASPEAMATFKPVFADRFRHREGPHLAAAFAAVLAEFRATARAPFPIPADIEAHMPRLRQPTGDAPIREQLDQRAERRNRLLADWTQGQGARIRAARPLAVYGSCWLEARDRAGNATDDSPIRLTADDIAACEGRALSSARAQRYGRIPRTADEWQQQIAVIRDEWSAQRAAA